MNIKKLIDIGVLADHVGSASFVLEALYNKEFERLDQFDDSNSNKNALIIYMELCKLGLLRREKGSVINFGLTEKGVALMSELLNKPVKVEKVGDWVRNYRQLWINPKTDKFYTDPDGRSLGASEKDLSIRLKTFLVEYREVFNSLPEGLNPEDVILRATLSHIEQFKKVSFAYSKDAYNFIYKQEGRTKDTTKSLLAAACENYISSYGKEKPKSTFGKSIN